MQKCAHAFTSDAVAPSYAFRYVSCVSALEGAPVESPVVAEHDNWDSNFCLGYHVRHALGSDAGSSIVYIFTNRDELKDVAARTIVRIRSIKRRRAIYCEAVINDEFFRKKYNKNPDSPSDGSILHPGTGQRTIVMGRWYRERLAIRDRGRGLPCTRLEVELPRRGWSSLIPFPLTRWRPWMAFWLSARHPVSTNRLATYLGVIGVVGTILAVVSLPPVAGRIFPNPVPTPTPSVNSNTFPVTASSSMPNSRPAPTLSPAQPGQSDKQARTTGK